MKGAGITILFYCKCKILQILFQDYIFILAKENSKETKEMLSGSPKQSIDYPKIMATTKKVRQILEMLRMDLSDFDKYKVYRNIDKSKIASTSV